MQQPNKTMDIHITMGQQDGLQFLTDTNVLISSNPNLVSNILAQSQFNQPIGNDIALVFHFYTQQGKEKQAVEYFNQALDQKVQQQKLSPIQRPLRRPINKGVVEVIEGAGCAIIKYRFFPQQFSSQQQVNQLEAQFNKYQKVTVELSASLKGHLKHNNKNRTNVKVDYVDLRMQSSQMTPSDFNKLFLTFDLGEDDYNFMQQIPALQMIGNLKSANFQLKMASFRQIKSYYNKASHDKLQKQEKPFPYENRGIFNKRVSAFGVFRNKIGFKADSTYNGEDVLMRLVKVYCTFLFQGLQI